MKKLNIMKIIDQWGWSYDFIGREQKRYSRHNIIIRKYNQISYDSIDIIYIHSPNIDPYLTHTVPLEARKRGIKVIGGYGGDPRYWSSETDKKYSHADLIVTISPETYSFAKEINKGTPVIFLPESIDSNFFKKSDINYNKFSVGWAGSNFPIKRTRILDKLKYPVMKKSEWGHQYFKESKNLDGMAQFYNLLNVFVLTSVTECMPRVILEAMSCGLPIISTRVGNIPLLLDEKWIVPVEPENTIVKEINTKLDLLKNNIDLQREVGERNRRHIEKNFCWEKTQPMWDDVFESLIEDDVKNISSGNDSYLNPHKNHFKTSSFRRTKIAYLFPETGISGGVATILQHANRLKEEYDVILISCGSVKEIKWFENKVPIILKDTLNKHLLDDIDILIMTDWTTVSEADKIDAKRKIYFVQSDERRFTEDLITKGMIHSTYERNFEFMTEAKWIQRWLKEEFNHDSYYVPNGVDTKIFNKVSSGDHKKIRVLLEGPISIPFKGVSDAYEVVKDLDCEIWIISSDGKPPKSWKYNKFFEKVPMNKMKEIYSSCDVLLKMSRIEGFFGPPLEAMACGCVVVVGKCTGYDEYIENNKNALVVGQRDIEGAKQAINKLIENESLRKNLIDGGFNTIKRWQWERTVSYLKNVIDGKPINKVYTSSSPRRYSYEKEAEKIKKKHKPVSYKSKDYNLNKKCDIILVSYNACDILKRCILSIEKYTEFPYQLIIVDNNSNEEVKEYLRTLKSAKIIFNNKNYGFGYANNQGLEISDSKYVCFLNSDTIVTSGWLSRLVKISEENKVDLIGPVTNYVSSVCQEEKFDYYPEPLKGSDKKVQDFAEQVYNKNSNKIVDAQRLVGFCLLTKRENLNRVGNFDERYRIGNFEDDDLCLRYIERGYKLSCAKGVFIYHYGGSSFEDEYKSKTNSKILERNRDIHVKKWYDTKRIENIYNQKEPLKILYLLASDGPSGGVKVIYEHCNRLQDRGHDVKIFCFRREARTSWFDIKVPVIYEDLKKLDKFDIAIGTYFSTLPYLKEIDSKVKMHLCQGYENLIYKEKAIKKTIDDSYYGVKEKIVVSKWLKEIIDEKFKVNSHFISNGIDPYVFSLEKHLIKFPPRVLVVGDLELGIKGVDIALNAVKNMVKTEEIHLVRMSSSRDKNLNIECESHIMTEMTQDQIADVYKSCDVTICASYKVEGFSLPPLESMASGTPVITSDSGGVNTYAKHNENAIILPSNSAEVIEHNLKLLLNNKKLYDKLIENGLKTAENYTWYNKIDELEKFFYDKRSKSLSQENKDISLCMIVKDEEEFLGKCLDSVKNLVSEMIIVDTGSTDNTIQIAKKFGANIYHYEWKDDFSAARNYALERVTKKWTLVLDADEIISERDISKFDKLLEKNKVAYEIVTRNYHNIESADDLVRCRGSYKKEEEGYIGWLESKKIRLFQTNGKIKFKGKVHEMVEDSIRKLKIKEEKCSIIIHHYGDVRSEKKYEIYRKLGEEKLKENENDIQAIVELARQYMSLNNHDEALVLWRRALKIQPDNYDILARLGTTYNFLKDFEQAEKYFKNSLKIQESEYAYKHLGICYAGQNNYKDAYECFSKIVHTTKDLKTKGDYAFCCNLFKKYDESIMVLEKCLKINRKETISWGLLEVAYNEKGVQLAKENKFTQALNLFQNAININPNFDKPKRNAIQVSKILNSHKQKAY